MVTIRLSRTGKKHAPQYRIVVQQKHTDPWSPAIEIVGTYNPRTNPSTIELKEESIKKWIANGAQPSNTVHNILVNAGIIEEKKKKKAVAVSNKRRAKLAEKKAEKEAKKAEAAEKAKEAEAPAEEAATKEEAPAAEEKAEEAPEEEVKEETPEQKEASEEKSE